MPAVSLILGWVVIEYLRNCDMWVYQLQSNLRLFVFDLKDELGFNMDLLDIGGGFPGTDDTGLQFEEVSCISRGI